MENSNLRNIERSLSTISRYYESQNQKKESTISNIWSLLNSSRIIEIFHILTLLAFFKWILLSLHVIKADYFQLPIFKEIGSWSWLTLLNKSLFPLYEFLVYFFIFLLILTAINKLIIAPYLNLGAIKGIVEKYFEIVFNVIGIIFMSNYIFQFNKQLSISIDYIETPVLISLFFFFFYFIVFPIIILQELKS